MQDGFLVGDLTGEPSTYGVVVPDPETHFVAPLYRVEGSIGARRLGRNSSPKYTTEALLTFEEPLRPDSATELALASKTDCVGALVVVFINQNGEKSIEVGSAFSIAPSLLATARHLLFHPSGVPGWMIHSVHFVMKDTLIIATVREKDDSFPNYKCDLISDLDVASEVPEDKVQTSTGIRDWPTKYDIVFLGVSVKVYELVGCLVPFSCQQVPPFVSSVGYPMPPKPRTVPYLFPTAATLPGEDRLISASKIIDLRNEALNQLFVFNNKMVSPGKVMDMHDNWSDLAHQNMLRLQLSVIGGISGGPCIVTLAPDQFVAILAGAFNCENFNVGVSVFHPLFVVEYLERVIPEFIEYQKPPPAAAKAFVDSHKDLIREEIYSTFMKMF